MLNLEIGTNKMASSDVSTNSEDHGVFADRTDTVIGYSVKETALKKEKARAKSDFTRTRNKLSALLQNLNLPSRQAVQDACSNMDSRMEFGEGQEICGGDGEA